jgi:formylglycine-generating enzyme required for sulfatase activity
MQRPSKDGRSPVRTISLYVAFSVSLFVLLSALSGCEDAAAEATSDMISVPGGAAWIGCDETIESSCEEQESPRFSVTVQDFEIDPTEVSVSAYVAFLNVDAIDNDCGGGDCTESFFDHSPVTLEGDLWSAKSGREDHPMTAVSWYGADAFCRSVSKRLCSEVEWEVAALGTCEAGNCELSKPLYPWGDEPPTCALAHMVQSSKGCDTDAMAAVGSYPSGASPYGALDMAGNAWEWVADTWREDYTPVSTTGEAWIDDAVPYRVVRGGGLGSGPDRLRGSHRFNAGATDKPAEYGLRCCR